MQPYFFPYLGYFSLIKNVDVFYLLEDVQFIRHGWIERNRVLKPVQGWQYIGIPLAAHSSKALIKEIRADGTKDWKARLLAQLVHYKKKAPFYKETINVIENCFGRVEDSASITEINKITLEEVSSYLGITTPIKVFNKIHELPLITAPDEWALRICELLKIDSYINPPGGKNFFQKEKYDASGIRLNFLSCNLKPYSQRRGPENIILGLSIIDVMMFNSIEAINEMLNDFILE